MGDYSVSHFLAGMKQVQRWDEGEAIAPEAGMWDKEGGVPPTHEVAAGSVVQSLGVWEQVLRATVPCQLRSRPHGSRSRAVNGKSSRVCDMRCVRSAPAH